MANPRYSASDSSSAGETPANQPAAAEQSVPDDTGTGKQLEEAKISSAGDGRTVLVVDDDPEVIESIRYAMESNGFQVSVARDGNQGLAMAEKAAPDLLILDMMMPKRSGFLVLEQLRREGKESVKVIMITGNEGHRHQQYAELLGVDDYIRKPFPMGRLVESAKKLLSIDAGE